MSSSFLYCQLLHVYNARKALTLSSRKFQNVQFIFSLLSFNVFPFREQNIVNTVGEEIKRLLEIFKIRNPMFNGKYSVCGHSLGRKWHSLNCPFFVDSFDLITGKGINVLLFWSIDTVEHLDLMLNGKFWNPLADRTGHFRAAQSFCFKARSRAIAMKMFIYCHANKPHFHKKGFGLNLVLEVRVLQTGKWPNVLKNGLQ